MEMSQELIDALDVVMDYVRMTGADIFKKLSYKIRVGEITDPEEVFETIKTATQPLT
jgi:hypothetical protein